MGLRKIFDGSAQFGRILDSESSKATQGIFVTGIVQKTGIEVNEEGSTAYTATGNVLCSSCLLYIFPVEFPILFCSSR